MPNSSNLLPDTDGTFHAVSGIYSVTIKIIPNSIITIDGKISGDKFIVCTSENRPSVGVAHNSNIGFQNGKTIQIESNANYLTVYANSSGEVNLSGMRIYYGKHWEVGSVKFLDKNKKITCEQTSFFEGFNYGEPSNIEIFEGYCSLEGKIITGDSYTSLIVNVNPNKTYYICIPNRNRINIVASSNGRFYTDETYELLDFTQPFTYNDTWVIKVTTKSDTKAIMVYFFNDVYDYESNKNNIVISENEWNPSPQLHISKEFIPNDLNNKLVGLNVLIFGDSITDCCHIEIDDNGNTSNYYFNNPSNSYTDANGKTIRFSMWAKIMNDICDCNEIRNYAHYGASFKDRTRDVGLERQNVSYQIKLAMNDLNNPNNVFAVNDFNPDVVIFALGTNDGSTATDDYETTFNTTFENLDRTKFCQSVRHALERVKKAFPMALGFVVLPIQRADSDVFTWETRPLLKQIAERCGYISIDGASESGIIKENNVANGLGVTLKDGLHPNEKGQNLMARMIINAIESHYSDFSGMN